MSGSQGWIQAWMGMVSVSGFHSSTSDVRLGSTICSRMLLMMKSGRSGCHASITSSSGSG